MIVMSSFDVSVTVTGSIFASIVIAVPASSTRSPVTESSALTAISPTEFTVRLWSPVVFAFSITLPPDVLTVVAPPVMLSVPLAPSPNVMAPPEVNVMPSSVTFE